MNRAAYNRNLRGVRGFTMVEIILVVMIIMTLAALVLPKLAGQSRKAKINTTKIQISGIKTALAEFEIHAGRFPSTSEGLEALLKRPSGLNENEWPDKYVDEMPKDAWAQEFDYKCPSDHGKDYDIVSAGPDKQMGTPDDITNYGDDKSAEKK